MHILWLTENYFPQRGGMAQSCDRIVYSLRKARISIDLIHICSQKRKFQETLVSGGRNVSFPIKEDLSHTANLLWNFLGQPGLQKKYTHVLAFGGHAPMLIGPIFSKWLQSPLVVCLRGNDFDMAIFSPKRQDVLRTALTEAAAICSVSQSKIEKIKLWLGSLPLHFTPNGIELDEWAPSLNEKQLALEWREKFVPTKRKLIGVFGHLKAKKGLEILLEGLQLSGLKEKYHLLISGEWEEADEESLIDKGIAYTHVPFKDRYELLAYYPACDMVAIPSHYEGMPNVMLEAAALGIPILASRVDGMKDLLEEGNWGFLFHPGDPHDCARALLNFEKQDEGSLSMETANFETHIRNNYNAGAETERYIKVFESCQA
ncbi:MAG: glycosyltransferase family 4 protein [Bacteroidia bacterium]|nr:glycosyltransferase family 4 protein [Bacteroidia bacterium]